jgi:error-prone DNA polymerase
LIRPGPIQAKFVRPYTNRRLGLEPVTYDHPDLANILERTQGIPIFQEQAMAIAQALGGYSGSEADLLRRTMGNARKLTKLRAALDDLEAAMLRRSAAGEIAALEPPVAKKICEDLVSFSNYGFPESHAWSFALIGYVTAHLKAHHPAAFFIGLLNAQPMGFYPVSTLIHDAKRHGVEVRPPCLVAGDADCTVEETADPSRPAMRVGWRFVRGIGSRGLDALRTAHAAGPFTSIADVASRAALSAADTLALARAGAFAVWMPDRRHAAWEALRACNDRLPFAPAMATRHNPAPLTAEDLVFLDYDAVGMSVYGHPMSTVRDRVQRGGALDSRELARTPNGRMVTVTGLVTVRQRPSTAGGTIFLLLEDEHGYINVIVSKTLVEANEEVVKRAPFVTVRGRVENDGAAVSVVGQQFERLDVRALTHEVHAFR